MFSSLPVLLSSCSLVFASQAIPVTSQNAGTFSWSAIRSVDQASNSPSGSETSSINVGSNWYIPVAIGTPPQSFLFLGDTGAPGLSVASTLLPTQKQPPNAPKYDASKSSTAKQRANYTYFLEFGSGASSSGVVYQDAVTIGSLTIGDMDIEVQTDNNHNQTGSTSPRSGNLGLNFDHVGQTTKPDRLPTWVQRIVPDLKAGLFTVDFDTESSTGNWDFGFVNTSRYSGDIGYAPVINQTTLWHVQITGQQLANTTVASTDGWPVVVDTGSGGAEIPRSVADDYFAQVHGASLDRGRGVSTYPCSSSLPDFTFCIGSFRGTVPGAKLNNGPINGSDTCSSKLGIYNGDGSALWGQLMIEQFFVIFDWDGARVGFANKGSAQAGQATPTASASGPASRASPSGTTQTALTASSSGSTPTASSSGTGLSAHENRYLAGASMVSLLYWMVV